MPFPDYPLGTDVHRWVSAPGLGLAHIARQVPAGYAWKGACQVAFQDEPSTTLAAGKMRCGMCADWHTDHPKILVPDYERK